MTINLKSLIAKPDLPTRKALESAVNVPPPLSSEARIKEMAKAKNLDPKTGRSLSTLSRKRTRAPVPEDVKDVAISPRPVDPKVANAARCQPVVNLHTLVALDVSRSTNSTFASMCD